MVRHFLKVIGNERGFLQFIPAAKSAASGIASMFSKKKASEKRDETPNIGSYTENIPQYTMPYETATGKTATDILTERAKGGGVAFSPEQLSMYGQPYAQSALRNWRTVAQPGIEESFASKGLGRSTMAGQAEIEGYRDVLSDVGTNWAALNKWNEAMKQQGIQNALGGLQGLTGEELNQRNLQAGASQEQKNRETSRLWQNYQNTLATEQARREGRSELLPQLLAGLGGAAGKIDWTGGGTSKISSVPDEYVWFGGRKYRL